VFAQAGDPSAASLVAELRTVRPGSTFHAGVRIRLDEGWHTYWLHPGDSGAPPVFDWAESEGIRAGAAKFPKPLVIEDPPLVNYGYENEVVFPVPVSVADDVKPGARVVLSLDLRWLVCKDVCIPQQATLTLALPVVAGDPEENAADAEAVRKALARVPAPGDPAGDPRTQRAAAAAE
jgi:thiol:disulfide interchange protein DsbD